VIQNLLGAVVIAAGSEEASHEPGLFARITLETSEVPLPAALPLYGTGIGLMGLLAGGDAVGLAAQSLLEQRGKHRLRAFLRWSATHCYERGEAARAVRGITYLAIQQATSKRKVLVANLTSGSALGAYLDRADRDCKAYQSKGLSVGSLGATPHGASLPPSLLPWRCA